MRQFALLLIFLVGLLSFETHAAGPIMHAVLAQRWLAINAPEYTPEEKRLFILGSLFPDIRYLGVIKRNQTHFHGITLRKITEKDSAFERGILFHSYVDEFRDKKVRQLGIEKKFTQVPSRLQGTFLKLVEDQILHSQYNWADCRVYLATIPEEEKKWNIDLQTLTQWHTGLTLYFTLFPSVILGQIALFDHGILILDAATVKQWSILLPQYVADPDMQEYVNTLLSDFEKALSNQEKRKVK